MIWNFHAAHVVWECYKVCRYDRVLETNIDVVSTACHVEWIVVGRATWYIWCRV